MATRLLKHVAESRSVLTMPMLICVEVCLVQLLNHYINTCICEWCLNACQVTEVITINKQKIMTLLNEHVIKHAIQFYL